MDPINIIIPLGGKGERFASQGFSVPKALIPIYGKPMLFHVIDNLNINTNDNIVIVYNNILDNYQFSDLVRTKYPRIKLVRLVQQTSGASETVLAGISELQYNKILVLDCDTIYTYDVVSAFRASQYSSVFYTVKSPLEPPIYSYITLDTNNKILDIAEKVKISNNANTGAYGFASVNELCYYCKNNTLTYNNEPYTSCVIKTMLQANIEFYGIQLDPATVHSVGTPTELNKYLNSTYAHMFDLDGTLVITDSIYFEVWRKILNMYGANLTQDIFDTYIQGNSDKYVVQALLPGVNLKDGELSKLKDSLFMQHIDKIQPVPGAIDYVKSVKEAGNPVCIVTNCNQTVADGIIKYIGLENVIEFIVSSESCSNGKPSPDPYNCALNKFEITSDRALIYEDSKTGILSAKTVQPKYLIGICTSYSHDELLNYGVYIAVSNFNEPINMTPMSENKLKQYIENYYGTTTIETNKLKGGFIADVVKVKIENTDCILKIENTTPNSLSQMANQLQLYEREYYFYDAVSKYMKNIRIPRFIGLVKDNNYKTIGLLLENLFATGNMVPNLNLNVQSIDASLKIIDKMANMHSQFWNKPLKTVFPQLKTALDPCFYPFCNDYINNKWPTFVNKWNKVLTPEQLHIGEHIKYNFANIQRRLSQNNNTLLHGDIKSPNIFYDVDNGLEPIFLDWQHCSIGKGVQDLAFFIVESFDMNRLDTLLPLFKNYYYCKLLEYGVKNYEYVEFEKDIHDAFCYVPFFTAVWFGSMSEDELIDKNFPFFFIQKLFKILII
jgi:beta-phosphoglucomutase-like phosphatase (HAD superfamily)/molybdopterin-guanine dinucleotide biosynthesis protein A